MRINIDNELYNELNEYIEKHLTIDGINDLLNILAIIKYHNTEKGNVTSYKQLMNIKNKLENELMKRI